VTDLHQPSPDPLKIEFRIADRPGSWLFHVKRAALSLTFDVSTVYTFDREGRLYSTFQREVSCRRGLDGRILARSGEWRDGVRERQRRHLDDREERALVDRLQQQLAELSAAVVDGRIAVEVASPGVKPEAMAPWLERLRRWDGARLAADAAHFRSVYLPVSILPPDQYMALVVQVTEGCPWNRCTFCDFYRDRPHRVKEGDELVAHLEAVRQFLGEGLLMRRGIFLADGNLMSVSPSRLGPILDQVADAFQEERFAGWYAFCDVLGSGRFTPAELGDLRARGLQRLYIGLETGSDELRRLLRKPGTADQLAEEVARLHEAGIRVGVIALLGAGGRHWALAHEEDTIRALNCMPLGERDLVYFSPLVASPDSEYARGAGGTDLSAMSWTEMAAQRRRLEQGLDCRARGTRTAMYDIRDFTY